MRDILHNVPVQLRKRLLRPEIRRRALHAATAVAVGAAAGCGALDEPVAGAANLYDTTANDGQGGLDGVAGADAGRTQPDASTIATRVADAGSRPDVAADAGTTEVVTTGSVCRQDADWESYTRCCQANGWDWNKGCMAWGPPAPPEIDEAWMASLIQGLTDEVTA